MKRIYVLIVLLKCLIPEFGISDVSAQWVSVGPDGGYVKCLTKSGNRIYAATGLYWFSTSGFYYSEDDGNSWISLNNNTLPGDIRAIAIMGNSLFLGTGLGIYRSDDNGFTWTEKNNGIPYGDKWINHLTVSGNTIFAAGTNSGMIRSTDNGEHWTVVNAGLTDTYVYSLTSTESAVFAGTGDQMLGVFRSTDNGNSWHQIKNGMSYYDNGIWLPAYAPMITSLAFIGNDLYAGTDESQGIWKTSDNGENWVLTSYQTMNYQTYTSISGNSSVVLAGTRDGGGVIKSTNGGINWSESNNGIDNQGQVSCFLVDGNTILTGTKGGVYRSDNNGNSWLSSFNGIRSQVVVGPGLAVIGTDIFIGTQHGGVFRTSNEGLDWEEVNNGLPLSAWNLDALYSTTNALFAWDRVSVDGGNNWSMAGLYSPGTAVGDWYGPRWLEHNNAWFAFNPIAGIYRSINHGSDWELINNGIQNISNTFFHKIFTNGQTLFLGASSGLYFSIDNGDNWSTGYFPEFNIHSFSSASFISNGVVDVIGLGGGGGSRGIYISNDQGASWTKFHNLLVHKFVKKGNDLIASGTNLEIINGEEVEVPSVFLSQNNGQSWIKISENLSGILTSTITSSETNLFISKYSPPKNQVLCSANNGTTWIDVSEGLDQRTFAGNLSIINDKIFAGTNGLSLWKRNLSEFSTPAQPGVISGNGAPCSGATESYSVENVSGVTYSWQVPDDWSIIEGNGTNTITVTVGETAGIVLVIPTNGFGTGPSRYYMVNPLMSSEVHAFIEAAQNGICNGSTMAFNAETMHGGTYPVYSWLVNGNPAGDNSAEFSYIPANGDVISLVFTSDESCVIQNQVLSNEITAIVNDLPFVSWVLFEHDTICINREPFQLSGGFPEAGTYSGTGVTNNTFDPANAGVGTHLISFIYTDENGCSGISEQNITVNICAGVEKYENSMRIYPNPVSEVLNIVPLTGQLIFSVELFNLTGVKVYSQVMINKAGVVTLPVHEVPTGNYILRITSNEKAFVKSVIVRH